MPICACVQSEERIATKPFDFRERSAFSTVLDVQVSILFDVSQSGRSVTGGCTSPITPDQSDFFPPHSGIDEGYPEVER
jgi:hypothetical protein